MSSMQRVHQAESGCTQLYRRTQQNLRLYFLDCLRAISRRTTYRAGAPQHCPIAFRPYSRRRWWHFCCTAWAVASQSQRQTRNELKEWWGRLTMSLALFKVTRYPKQCICFYNSFAYAVLLLIGYIPEAVLMQKHFCVLESSTVSQNMLDARMHSSGEPHSTTTNTMRCEPYTKMKNLQSIKRSSS